MPRQQAIQRTPVPAGGRKHHCKWRDPQTDLQCRKTFNERRNLMVHMRMHTGKKPYWCKICGVRFSTSGNKNDHERRHAGIKPYACPVPGCTTAYYRRYQLVKHGSSRKHQNLIPGYFEYMLGDQEPEDQEPDQGGQGQKIGAQEGLKATLAPAATIRNSQQQAKEEIPKMLKSGDLNGGKNPLEIPSELSENDQKFIFNGLAQDQNVSLPSDQNISQNKVQQPQIKISDTEKQFRFDQVQIQCGHPTWHNSQNFLESQNTAFQSQISSEDTSIQWDRNMLCHEQQTPCTQIQLVLVLQNHNTNVPFNFFQEQLYPNKYDQIVQENGAQNQNLDFDSFFTKSENF